MGVVREGSGGDGQGQEGRGSEGEVSSPCRDKGYTTCVQGFCGCNGKVSESLGVSMRLVQPNETEVEEEDNGLWICKIEVKTKLRKLLQTSRVFYSRESIALGKYSYTKVSHEESRHSLKGLVHVS
jgi:hypothetical protein